MTSERLEDIDKILDDLPGMAMYIRLSDELERTPRAISFEYWRSAWETALEYFKNLGSHFTDSAAKRDAIKLWDSDYIGNIGIATGSESGLLVLDIDPGKGGADSLKKLLAEHGPLPETVEVITGGGGTHFYFQYPEGTCKRHSTAPRMAMCIASPATENPTPTSGPKPTGSSNGWA